MRLLRLQSVICTYFVTTVVMTSNAPEYSEESVTYVDAGSSMRQFSAVADTILPMVGDTWALAVNPVMNVWRIAAGIDTPGLEYMKMGVLNVKDYNSDNFLLHTILITV